MNLIKVNTDLTRSQASAIIVQSLRDAAAQYRHDANQMRLDGHARLVEQFEKQAIQAAELATSIEYLN